jgi:hypothetical protein
LTEFLAENLVNPQIKLVYRRDKMQDAVFNAEEHAKEIEGKRSRNMKAIGQQQTAKNMEHGNGEETEKVCLF